MGVNVKYDRVVFCEEAAKLISSNRKEQYGGNNSLVGISSIWSSYLGVDIAPSDVCAMMSMLKHVRAKYGVTYHADNYVDACGYDALAGEFAAKEKEHAKGS